MAEVFTIKDQIDKCRAKLEINSKLVDSLVKELVSEYTKELDEVLGVAQDLIHNVYDISDEEFEALAIKIPVLSYWAQDGKEAVGVRQDLSKIFEKEKANRLLQSLTGTVKAREAVVLAQTQAESIVTIATSRAYKIICGKLDAAYELYTVVKKILTRRIGLIDKE